MQARQSPHIRYKKKVRGWLARIGRGEPGLALEGYTILELPVNTGRSLEHQARDAKTYTSFGCRGDSMTSLL